VTKERKHISQHSRQVEFFEPKSLMRAFGSKIFIKGKHVKVSMLYQLPFFVTDVSEKGGTAISKVDFSPTALINQ